MASQYQNHQRLDRFSQQQYHQQQQLATTKPTNTAVTITQTLNIHPKTVPHGANGYILNLSNLDRQCPALMYTVFFYKPTYHQCYHGDHHIVPSVFSSLKAGLEETLSLWYPASGRLIPNPNNHNKLDLLCNNAGVVLVEGETQMRVSDLGNDLSQYNHFFESLVYKPPKDVKITEMPLVVAQVTKFGCGGYTVGIGTSHALFDGPAAFNFFSAWASNANFIRNRGHHVTSSCKLISWEKPVHGRGRLLMMLNSDDQTSTEKPVVAAAIGHLYKLITQAAYEAGGATFDHSRIMTSTNHLRASTVLKTIHINGTMIDNLKRNTARLSNPASSSSSPYSSFEILAAHLWKSKTKAQVITNKNKTVCLQFAVDVRTKLIPTPLPQSFSGNAYVLGSVALLAGQLHHESLDSLVCRIREAKRTVNAGYVSSYMEALGQQQQQGSLSSESSEETTLGLKELTMVSDWTRMPLHKVSFVNDGEAAEYACPLMGPMPQVGYFMRSPKDGCGVDVRIGLDKEIVGAFEYYFLQGF